MYDIRDFACFTLHFFLKLENGEEIVETEGDIQKPH